MAPGRSTVLHASAVAWDGRAALILGPSGWGKSALALQLMAYGADLIADDRTQLLSQEGRLMADAPATLRGMIEARGIGILNARAVGPVRVAFAVDLTREERARLPERRSCDILDISLPLIWGRNNDHLGPAVLQYLKAGEVPGS